MSELVGMNGQAMIKAKPGKEAQIKMAVNQLNQAVSQMSQRLAKVEGAVNQPNSKTVWIRYKDEVFALIPGVRLKACGNHVEVTFPNGEGMIIDPLEFDKVKEWNKEYAEGSAEHVATTVMMSWIMTALMETGGGCLDLAAEMEKLQIQAPVDSVDESHNQEGSAEASA